MRFCLKKLVLLTFAVVACEEATLRDQQSKPTDDGEGVEGYVAETIKSVTANSTATISIAKTTLTIKENSLAEDAEVRLRTLKVKPDRESVASLGDARGDVVEVTVYHKETNEIFAANVLSDNYELSQSLDGVEDEKNLKYVIISSPGTDDEKVDVVGRSALTTSAALSTNLTLSLYLSVTHAIIYAVESAEIPANIIIIISDSSSISNNGGSVVIATPNSPANVVDGTSSSSLSNSPEISWTASPSEGVSSYEVGIGSGSGLVDLKAWSDIGLVLKTQITGLSLSAGKSYYASVRAVASSGEKSIAVNGDGWAVTSSSIDCSGLAGGIWVGVPKNPAVGQNVDFCVMKYEAKNVGGAPTSEAAGTPWVNISQTESITVCASLGAGYELITNEMWQTIARNIETAQSAPGVYFNWSGDPPSPAGANSLNRGNSNQGAALASDSDDANGCIGITSNGNPDDDCSSSWHVNKRTHTLSNGEVIWDLAGNVWGWTSSTLVNQGSDGYISQNPATDKTKWGPEGDYSAKNSGEYGGLGYGYLAYSGGAVLRGGYWTNGANAGVFFANLGSGPSLSSYGIGMRCGRPAD